MKNIFRQLLITFLLLSAIFVNAEDDEVKYAPYYKVASIPGSIDENRESVVNALELHGFEVIGEYNPGKKDYLYVICYTRTDLKDITLNFEDRGALASVLKVGFFQDGDDVEISMLNPMYLFYAYLLEGIDEYEERLMAIANDSKDAMATLNGEMISFGGMQSKNELQKYHYKIMMPYFTDPEELKEFSTFMEGISILRKNLDAGKGNTVKVYELVYEEREIAVFGVGLLDPEKGESHFLPKIGEKHIAALPYEIIIQGNTASMLHGKYRFALHWPELTMGTFMKIMGTPGDVEDTMELLTE
jgi:hypothetical protein